MAEKLHYSDFSLAPIFAGKLGNKLSWSSLMKWHVSGANVSIDSPSQDKFHQFYKNIFNELLKIFVLERIDMNLLR